MAKTILHTPVMTKARKRFGQAYPSQPTTYNAEIVPGESIRIWGLYSGREFDKTFKMGDVAVYGSYNLIYTGTIESIGANSVGIREYPGDTSLTRLDLNTFCWRNFDFDQERINAHNLETSYCI